MNIKNLKIGTQFKIGLILPIIFVILLGVIAYMQSYKLHEKTKTLYDHPLAVGRAIGKLKSDVFALQRDMKDLFIVSSDKDIYVEKNWIKWFMEDATLTIDSIYSHYLGPRKDVDLLKQDLDTLKYVCENTIDLIIHGNKDEAFIRTKTFGIIGFKVEKLMQKLEVISNFSIKKGDELYYESIKLDNLFHKQLFFLIAAILLFSIIINIILLRNISKPLVELTNATQRYQKGDINARTSYSSQNEFGVLSASFNNMIEKIKIQSEDKEKKAEEIGFMKGKAEENELINENLRKINADLIFAKEKIKETEMYYRELFDSSPDGVIHIGLDGCITLANIVQAKIYRYDSPNDMIGINANLLVAPSSREYSMQIIQRRLNGEEIPPVEYELIRKDGTVFIGEVSAALLKNTEGNVLGYICITHDITKRKQIENELRQAKDKAEESEIYFRQLFENMEQGFAVHEMIYDINNNPVDYRYILINKAFEKLTGICATDILGKTVKEALPHTEQIWIENYGKVAQTGIPINFENYSVEFDKYYNVIAYSPKKNFFAVVFTDVTKNKNYENELIKAKEKAEESDRLKSAFLANMSHEIRTPMNGILGFTELLKNADMSSEKYQEYISILQKSCNRLLNIINDIINISKVESGQMNISISKVNLNELNLFIYSFFKPEAEQNGTNIVFKKSLNSNEAYIYTDKEKVYAVIINLVKNAIKFTEKGSIEFGYDKKDKFIEFFVKDTGIGIRQKQKDIIFERFRQASEGDTRNYQGAGLGLSISKAYVEMLGGKIWVESEERKGSTFYFNIPFNNAPKEKNVNEDIVSDLKKENGIKNLKILIAEDDIASGIYLTKLVNQYCREVYNVVTGAEAVETCRNNPDIDLVLMDIQMSTMNGIEATKQIRKFNKDIIIIAQTAHAIIGDKEKVIEAGCNDYISKPIIKDELLTLIQKYFNTIN